MERFIISLALCSAVMTAVSLVYMLACRLFGRSWSPKWRYYIWLVPVTGFLTPFKPQLSQPVVELSAPAQGFALQADAHGPGLDVYALLAALWVIGFAAYLIYTLIKHVEFTGKIERLGVPADAAAQAVMDRLADEIKLKKRPQLIIMPRLGTPMMTGLQKPLILLPAAHYGDDALRMIIMHELTHLKRRDLLYKLLVIVCRAVHWFNPFMFVIARSIDQACELSCDEAVVQAETTQARKVYCNSILDAIKRRNALNDTTVFSTGFGAEKKGLEHRIRMVFSTGRRRNLAVIGAALLVATLLSGTMFVVSGDDGGSVGGDMGSDGYAHATTTLVYHETSFAETTFSATTTAVTATTSPTYPDNVATTSITTMARTTAG